ncbi:50S ribosomal protein L23 [Chrysiogenes arsenatis]|uniref:50S ribosomal protein L23 n=1 Tax=Chrysiogenes arsenatis TaxID=309797 RepID=UPI000424D00E|nr:50S ribosomal protein L23 [Chrysiogenes arsenatis]
MELYSIIKRPVATERAVILNEKFNQVVFEVDKRANKIEIKAAVEKIFSVKVSKVSVSIVKGKVKRTKFGMGKRNDWKKAFVTLADGSTIKLFEE